MLFAFLKAGKEKLMEINTTLFRKEPRFDTRLCKAEKILALNGSDFVYLKENLLEEYDFL